MDTTEHMDAAYLLALLRERHSGPEWAFFEEMPAATGFSPQRLDAWAMNVWKSKQFRMIAYEVKVTRADFKRELDSPAKREKAEALATDCWFVVPHGLVQPSEVPEGWGLLCATKGEGGGLRQVKFPTQRPLPILPPSFIAALARRASDRYIRTPLVAWRYRGEELDEERLLAVADATMQTTVAERTRRIAHEAVEEFRRGDEHKGLRELQSAVIRHCGYEAATAEGFTAWAKERTRSLALHHPRVVGKLRALHESLGELLTDLVPAPSSDISDQNI